MYWVTQTFDVSFLFAQLRLMMCDNSRGRVGVSGIDVDPADSLPTVLKSSSCGPGPNIASATGKILVVAMRVCRP
jgi:hypothetical protein